MSLLTGTNFLGPITRAISAEPNSQLSIGYSIKAKNLLVMGKLSSGRGETAGWENIENTKGIMTLVYLCSKWDEFSRHLSPEYTEMCILLHKESYYAPGDIMVTNSAEAKQFVEKWSRWYQNL